MEFCSEHSLWIPRLSPILTLDSSTHGCSCTSARVTRMTYQTLIGVRYPELLAKSLYKRLLDNCVDWSVDPHLHWQILEDKLQEGSRRHFPPQRRPPRAELFTNKTWDSLKSRKQLKMAVVAWWSLGSGLRAWKDGMTYIDVDRLLLLDQHALLILRQMLLQDFRIMSRHCHF